MHNTPQNIALPHHLFLHDDNLMESFDKNGILAPIITTSIGEKKYIVDGIKRYCTAMINKEECPEIEIQVHSIREIIEKRRVLNPSPPSLIDKINSLLWLIPAGISVKSCCSLLRFPYKEKIVSSITDEDFLTNTILEAIGKKTLKEKSMSIWTLFPEKELKKVIALLDKLTLNGNQDKQFFELLWHIHIVKEFSISKIISTVEIPKLSQPQINTHVLSHLKKIAFPHLTEKKSKIRSHLNHLNRNKDIRFSWVDFGEEGEFSCHITFHHSEEFKKRLSVLNKISQSSDLTSMTETLLKDMNE